MTLRYRSGEGDDPIWTIKLPIRATPILEREEVPFHATSRSVPDEVRNLVTAYIRSKNLRPVATLRTKRRRWLLKNADAQDLAELVDDEVSVLENRRVVARFREIEVEKRAASKEQLKKIAEALRDAGASNAEPIPKVVRALGARATAPSDLVEVADLSPEDPSSRVIEASIATAAQRLIRNDPVARIGNDPEGVHQMRVATRRLRSDLKTFKSLLKPEWLKPLLVELKWLADELGSVRDLDVLQENLRNASEDLEPAIKPLFDSIAERTDRARAALMDALVTNRYRSLLDTLVAAPGSKIFTIESLAPCRELPKLLRPMWKVIAAEGRVLDRSDNQDKWHSVRIRCKRIRYASEAIAPALGSDKTEATRFARQVADVQEVLGVYQDSVVAQETIAKLAEGRPDDGPFYVAIGRLLERQSVNGARARARFPKAWGKLDRKKNLRWLTAPTTR